MMGRELTPVTRGPLTANDRSPNVVLVGGTMKFFL